MFMNKPKTRTENTQNQEEVFVLLTKGRPINGAGRLTPPSL